jgi:signal transduction histidine kinase
MATSLIPWTFLPHTIRGQVAAVIALTVALMAGVLFVTLRQHQRRELDDARANVAWQAKLVNRDMERLLQGTEDLIAGMVRHPALRNRDLEACNQLLEGLHSSFPQYLNLFMIEEHEVLCSALPEGRSRVIPTGLVPFESSEIAVSRFLHSPIDGKPMVGIIQPLSGPDGVVRSTVGVTLNLAWLNEQMERSPAPSGGVVVILDGNGTVLARNPEGARWLGKPAFDEKTFSRVTAQPEFQGELTALEDVPRIWALERTPNGGGLRAGFALPTDAVYGPSRRLLFQNATGLALAFAVAISIAMLGTRRVALGPLLRLRRAASQLSSGDLSVRSGLPYRGEIGELGRAFDEMAGRLEAHFESAAQGILTVDASGRVTQVNRAVERMFGYGREEIVGQSRELLIAGSALASGEEVRARRKDGSEFPAKLDFSHIEISTGRVMLAFLTDMTERRAHEAERQRMLAELRELTAHIEQASEQERIRIAREIHDELGQRLTGLKMRLARLGREAEGGAGQTGALEIAGDVDAAIRTLRRIATELRPGVLDALGLVPALQWLAQDFSEKHCIRCVADCTEIETGAGTATTLFRITQEALTNLAKHAGATEVRIRLRADGGGIELSVADDGKGIETSGRFKPGSFGLLGIKERVASLQGMLEIGAAPAGGTILRVTLPGTDA